MRVPHLPPSTARRCRGPPMGERPRRASANHSRASFISCCGLESWTGHSSAPECYVSAPGCGQLFHRRRVCDDGASCVSNADVCGGLWRLASGYQHSGAVNRLPPILRHPSHFGAFLRCAALMLKNMLNGLTGIGWCTWCHVIFRLPTAGNQVISC